MSLPSSKNDPDRLLALRELLETALVRECERLYGDWLVSLVEYGSVARGTIHAESDLATGSTSSLSRRKSELGTSYRTDLRRYLSPRCSVRCLSGTESGRLRIA